MALNEPGDTSANACEQQTPFDPTAELMAWAGASNPAPCAEAEMVFALSVMSTVAFGYNIDGSGLSQYWLLFGRSGAGKGIIQNCSSELFSRVSKSVPSIVHLKGKGHIASGQALIKSLASKPFPASQTILDEFGEDLEEMTNPTNLTAKVKRQVLLQLWALSGAGSVFDGMAYSDKEKDIPAISSPNLTLVGITTPDKANRAFKDELAHDGLLARFIVVETQGELPPFNAAHKANLVALSNRVVERVADIAAESFRLASNRQVREVELDPDADAHFKAYAERIRAIRNANPDATTDLLSRSHLKAMKLAATVAVGLIPFAPKVSLSQAQWATGFIDAQTNRLIAKFENGIAGGNEGSETAQARAVIREISKFIHREYDNDSDLKFGVTYEMHKAGVVPQTYLSRKLLQSREFRDKYTGGTRALVKVLDGLVDSDELGQIPKLQMQQQFGSAPKAYVVKIPTRFLPP